LIPAYVLDPLFNRGRIVFLESQGNTPDALHLRIGQWSPRSALLQRPGV
jgi:hypothetical protein